VSQPQRQPFLLRRLLPALVIVLLCGVAVTPLLRGTMPCTHDGDLHYHRVAAMRHALRNGIVFSRWMPDLAFGYGYPFFNYREPFSYYLSLGLHLLGLPLPTVSNLIYVLCFLAAAGGAYVLARDLFGPRGGLVAAVAYAYAPYQFLDAVLRGNLLESIALALFPWILWAFRRLALREEKRWFVVSVGLLTTLMLSHNISSLLFVPFLFLYLVTLAIAYRWRGRWVWAVLALALALGLTTFFWLPALTEQGYVQLHMSRVTRNNDFHYNFLGLAEIFAPPEAADTALINPPMEIHVGLALATLGLLGLVLGWIRTRRPVDEVAVLRQRERRASLIFFAAFAVVFLFMSTSASLWLWEHVPLLPFVQFPWRFVGRAILPLVLLAAAAFYRPTEARTSGPIPRRRAIPVLLAVAALILAAVPATYPPLGYCPMGPYPSIETVHQYERESGLVGVDPEGSYFPAWVEERPQASPLEAQYDAGETIARFDASSLPPEATLVSADYGPNRAHLVIDTPTPFRARYLTFFFPGWRVRIDGELTEVAPSSPQGLITFPVPAGRHEVTIRFGETPLRAVADAGSILSLLVFLLLLIRPPRFLTASGIGMPSAARSLALVLGVAALSLGLLLLGFKLAVVDRAPTVFRHPGLTEESTLPGVSHSLYQPYAGGLTLIGFDQEAQAFPADRSLRLDLYWTPWQRPNRRIQSTVYLVGPDGFLWSPENSFRPRGYHRPPPAHTWGEDEYVIDSHVIEPLPGTPPGTYQLVVNLFDRDTLVPLSALDEAGQPAAPQLTLGSVTVTAPQGPVSVPDRGRVDASLGDVTLLVADFDRQQAAPGDTVYLDALWRDGGTGTGAAVAPMLALRSLRGEVVAEYAVPLTADRGPGDVWRSQHRLTLPATLESGTYVWTVHAAASDLDRPGPTIGELAVAAPPHVYTAPPLDVTLDVPVGDVATLLGASFDPPPAELAAGDQLAVTLAWRAEATAGRSYHVFLHLLDAGGNLVVQSDGVPAGWTRPTTGWLPGEVIVDPRSLSLPADASPGVYTVVTGLYLPGGDRLVTPEGADAIPLITFTVVEP
jgi:hypothetical protein